MPACQSAESGQWGGSVSAIPASAGRQNRKIFVSLIEKNFWGAPLKNDEKIFLFCSPSGERKRWGGFLPVRAEMLAQKRFALRSVIAGSAPRTELCSGAGLDIRNVFSKVLCYFEVEGSWSSYLV